MDVEDEDFEELVTTAGLKKLEKKRLARGLQQLKRKLVGFQLLHLAKVEL